MRRRIVRRRSWRSANVSRSTSAGTMNPAFDRVEIDRPWHRGLAELAHEPLAVRHGEVRVDVHDLGEQVEIGRERRRRRVEEHQVLHEQHQVLRARGRRTRAASSPGPRARRPARRPTCRRVSHRLGRGPRSAIPRRDRCRTGRRRGRTERSSWPRTSPAVPLRSSRRKASRCGSSSRPVMPKSNRTVRPDGCTRRLPPCRSPWNTPYSSAPSSEAMSPARSTALVSTPAACIDSTSSNANPRSRSMTSTRRVTSTGCGRGTTIVR